MRILLLLYFVGVNSQCFYIFSLILAQITSLFFCKMKYTSFSTVSLSWSKILCACFSDEFYCARPCKKERKERRLWLITMKSVFINIAIVFFFLISVWVRNLIILNNVFYKIFLTACSFFKFVYSFYLSGRFWWLQGVIIAWNISKVGVFTFEKTPSFWMVNKGEEPADSALVCRAEAKHCARARAHTFYIGSQVGRGAVTVGWFSCKASKLDAIEYFHCSPPFFFAARNARGVGWEAQWDGIRRGWLGTRSKYLSTYVSTHGVRIVQFGQKCAFDAFQ